MTNNELNITSFDYCLENGAAWIIIDNDLDYTVQCCLVQGERQRYIKQIKKNDNGHDWGISANVNANLFEKYGKEKCMNALYREARKRNFKIV